MDQLAHRIQSSQRQNHKQDNFLIGQLLWKHGDVTEFVHPRFLARDVRQVQWHKVSVEPS